MNHATIEEIYKVRIEQNTRNIAGLQKLENRLVFFRLLAFVGSIVLFYLFLPAGLIIAIALLLMGLALLGFLVGFNLRKSRQKQHYQYLREICEKEIGCLKGDYRQFPDGAEYIDKEHPYSSDLDVFGKASLFQYLNRTTSSLGSRLLADWLKSPAEMAEILRRQEAIGELKNLIDWRQNLSAVGYRHADSTSSPDAILHWMNKEPLLTNRKYLPVSAFILSLAAFIVVVLLFFGLPPVWLTLVIIVNLLVTGLHLKKINQIHRDVTKTVGLLQSYSDAIELTEKETFHSQRLLELQNRLQDKGNGAAAQLKILSKLVNKLDYRLNLIVGTILNIFFFWDIWHCLQLERWKRKNLPYIQFWFDAMAEFEALTSLANAGFNNPGWIMPSIVSGQFTLRAVDAGHPLIPETRRINNSLTITGTPKIVIVTGSNMSGKSTFQRTCGVNMVLAMAGSPVCATRFEMSPVTVYTSMRIADSLDENTSSFYAELKRLAAIISCVERGDNVFLLLDEILRGTNSNDRHIGSVALIRQMIANHATGMVATHDLELSRLINEFPEEIENYNFDVKVNNDELYFDYRLNQGICQSLNASILMKKMGIHIP